MKKSATRKILTVVLVFCVMLWLLSTYHRDQNMNLEIVSSTKGVWDLQEIDFNDKILKLDGSVRYIPNELLDPLEFEESYKDSRLGVPSETFEVCTAKLVILLPDNEKYMLKIEGDVARNVYVNGELVGSNGVPALNEEDFKASHFDLFEEVKPINSEIEIIIQGANFVNSNISPFSDIHIGTPEDINWYFDLGQEIGLVIIGMLFMLVIIHVIVLVAFNGTYLNFICAWFCFVWSIRFGVYETGYFFSVLPQLTWELAFRIEHLAMPVSGVFVMNLILNRFKTAMTYSVSNAYSGLAFVVLCIVALASTKFLSQAAFYLYIIYICVVIYLSAILLAWIYNNRHNNQVSSEEKLSTVPLFVIFYATIHDSLHAMGIYLFSVPYRMTEVAILFFAVCETVLLLALTLNKIKAFEIKEEENRIKAYELQKYLQMKSHFIGIIAHEIKTPLSIIMGGASESEDLLYDMRQKGIVDMEEIDDIERNQEVIMKTVKTINEVVFDLLDTTAIETGRLTLNFIKVDLSVLVPEIIEQFRIEVEKRNIKLLCEIPEKISIINADEKRLTQVIYNVMSNALRYTNNGEIKITVWEDEYKWISISDTGIGISDDVLHKIRQQSYIEEGQNGHRGGIGLYVCQQIINSHNGKFEINQNRDGGTNIMIGLPENNDVYGKDDNFAQ